MILGTGLLVVLTAVSLKVLMISFFREVICMASGYGRFGKEEACMHVAKARFGILFSDNQAWNREGH